MKTRTPIEYLSTAIVAICILYYAYYKRKHDDIDTSNFLIGMAFAIFIAMAFNIYKSRKKLSNCIFYKK